MKYSYLYSGLQAAFVFSGHAVLPNGVPTNVDEDIHKALSKNKFAKHLTDSGDLTVTEIAEDGATKATGKGSAGGRGKNGKQESAVNDAEKAAGEAALATVQAELTELGITFSEDETLEQLQAKLTQAKE